MAEKIDLLEEPKTKFSQNLLLFVGASLLILGLLFFLLLSSQESTEVEIISSTEEDKKEMVVDVAGAVEKPGVYRLKTNSRINDALLAAGGLSLEADREWVEKNINLAASLKDGIKIYIKSAKDIKNQSQESGAGAGSNKINLNTASLSELDRLPGIGQVLGQRIIDYREKNGSFSSPEDILKVTGISQKLYEKIKEQVTLW